MRTGLPYDRTSKTPLGSDWKAPGIRGVTLAGITLPSSSGLPGNHPLRDTGCERSCPFQGWKDEESRPAQGRSPRGNVQPPDAQPHGAAPPAAESSVTCRSIRGWLCIGRGAGVPETWLALPREAPRPGGGRGPGSCWGPSTPTPGPPQWEALPLLWPSSGLQARALRKGLLPLFLGRC